MRPAPLPLIFQSAIALVLSMVGSLAMAAASSKVITLEGPSETPSALYVQAVLETAYGELGYTIDYQAIPLARSFVEANQGNIDGLRARVGTVADSYENLMKVPYRLLNFRMVLVADRRHCGICEISSLSSVVMSRGYKAFSDYLPLANQSLNRVEVHGDIQALKMLQAGKVDGAIVSDVNIPDDFIKSNPHWLLVTLAELPDFHYLHKRHSKLAERLHHILITMDKQGIIAKLQRKYGIQTSQPAETRAFGDITAVADLWERYTNPQTGAYWKMLQAVYSDKGSRLNPELVNWKRAKQKFARGKYDILVSAYDFEVSGGALRSQLHIDYELPLLAFGRDQQKMQLMFAGESTGSICFRLGYDFHHLLPESLVSYEVPAIEDCERMLAAGRIDVIVEYARNLSPEIQDTYKTRIVKEGLPLYLGFHNTPRGRALKAHFEQSFRTLLSSGEGQQWFANERDFINAKLVMP